MGDSLLKDLMALKNKNADGRSAFLFNLIPWTIWSLRKPK